MSGPKRGDSRLARSRRGPILFGSFLGSETPKSDGAVGDHPPDVERLRVRLPEVEGARPWAWILSGVPVDAATGFDWERERVQPGGEVELIPYAVLLLGTHPYPDRPDVPTARLYMLSPDGTWSSRGGFTGRFWAVELRKRARDALADAARLCTELAAHRGVP